MAFEKLKQRLEYNGFKVSVFDNKEDATAYMDNEIDGKTIGIGGSLTIQEMGLKEALVKHNTIYCHGFSEGSREEILRNAMTTDIYILSANAISEDKGEILNIDGTGNRVSSSLFGHKKVYFVAGKNKISKDFDSALYRLRNVVAPKNAHRLHRNTPCAIKGDRCYDCNAGEERICNALVVFYKKIRSMDMEVILIDEELGY